MLMPLFLLHNQSMVVLCFSAFGKALKHSCLTFLRESAIDEGIPKRLKLERSYALVEDTSTGDDDTGVVVETVFSF